MFSLCLGFVQPINDARPPVWPSHRRKVLYKICFWNLHLGCLFFYRTATRPCTRLITVRESVCSEGKVCVLRETCVLWWGTVCYDGEVCVLIGKCVCVCVFWGERCVFWWESVRSEGNMCVMRGNCVLWLDSVCSDRKGCVLRRKVCVLMGKVCVLRGKCVFWGESACVLRESVCYDGKVCAMRG